MANEKNPYEILGVSKTASGAEIKSAYRKLAKQHHPDLNPGKKEAEARFREIGLANDLLSDAAKRAAFDRGEIDIEGQPKRPQFSGFSQGPRGKRQQYQQEFSGFDSPDIEDIFGSFFGAHGAQRHARPMQRDVHYQIEIDFLEAALGAQKRVTMPDGRSLNITIPEGIEEGKQLRLAGQGTGSKAQPGDAYIEVHIRPHPVFTRAGKDIRSEVAIGFHESILGSKIEVPTIRGNVEMAIPKGSGSGAVLRLKGKGIKGGDQYVVLKIVMPAKIDSDLEEAIKAWAHTHGYNPRK